MEVYISSTLDPKKDTHFSYDMHRSGKWEYETTAFLVKLLASRFKKETSKHAFIDVGANLGYFTLLAASLNFTVIAFEPVSFHAKELLKSIYINGFDDHVTVYENIVSTLDVKMKINPYLIGPSPTAYVSFPCK